MDQAVNKWALITGASSGIGEEFARELSKRGTNLVLVARREENLNQLSEELAKRDGTKSLVIPIDLTDVDAPKKLHAKVREEGIVVDLLINNAGFGFVGKISETEPDRMLKMIQLNISALTELTYLFLPEMMERESGSIMNVASVAAFQPIAYMPVYSASKSYVLHFSEAIWAEAREKNVSVMALCPGTTRTDFFDVAGTKQGWLERNRSQSVQEVVKAGLKALRKKRSYVVPGWINYFLALAVRLGERRFVVLSTRKYFKPRDNE